MERRKVQGVTDVTEPAAGPAQMTIDELARRSGMTVRNIRAHQSRGLLPPPEVRGRTGFYTDEHAARIELIREMQGEGFNLEAIRRLLEGPVGGSGQDALDFARRLRQPFEDEEPQIVDLDWLLARFGEGATFGALRRAQELGVLRDLGDGTFETISPSLLGTAGELADLGIALRTALDVAGEVRGHAEQVAQVFVRLFLREVWLPFEQAGAPPERWAEVADALERVRPLAGEAVLAIFQMAMSDAVDEAIGREVERLGDQRPPGRAGGRRGRRLSRRAKR